MWFFWFILEGIPALPQGVFVCGVRSRALRRADGQVELEFFVQQKDGRFVHSPAAMIIQKKLHEKNIVINIMFVLYCPAVFGRVLDPPGNHPRGAIFPTVD